MRPGHNARPLAASAATVAERITASIHGKSSSLRTQSPARKRFASGVRVKGRKPSVPLGSADRLAVHESAVRSYDANLLRYGSPAIRSAPPQSKRAWLRAQLAKRKEYLEAIRALLDGGGATLLPGRAAAYGRIEEESLDDILAKLDA